MTSSVFPAALDSFVDPDPTSKCNASNPTGPVALHSALHALENDAIAALQAKVGINGSTNVNSLDYKVAAAIAAILSLKSYIGTTTNSGNAYTAGDPPSGGYVNGNLYVANFNAANTGPATLDSEPIHLNGAALASGAISAGAFVALLWDGAQFNMTGDGSGGGSGGGASTAQIRAIVALRAC